MEVLFPKYSTNLVIGVSNSGKSFLIQHFLSKPEFYFEQIPENIYIVHCNNQTPDYNLPLREDVKIHEIYIEDFDLNAVEPNSVLVFEDVNKLYETIKVACNVATHHLPLLALFIVSQGVTRNSHFELVKIVHRAIFCLGSTSAPTSKAADFIINYFYRDLDTKIYLKKILNFAEKQETHLLLKLNSIAARPSPFLACTHFNKFDYYLAFTIKNLSNLKLYSIKKNCIMSFESVNTIVDPPENTFVVMPLKSVQEQVALKVKPLECATKNNWDKVREKIHAAIEADLPVKRWRICTSLADKMLNCNEFCITEDASFVHLKSRPNEST